jgi:hypothetical protein
VHTPSASVGSATKTLLERLLFHRRQGRGPTRLSLGGDRFEAVIPIHIHPVLHESSAAAQSPCDGGGLVTFEGQENGSIAISLFGIPLPATLLTQLRQVLWMMKLDLHLTVPPVSPRVCQISDPGATLFLTGAREFFLIRIIERLLQGLTGQIAQMTADFGLIDPDDLAQVLGFLCRCTALFHCHRVVLQ